MAKERQRVTFEPDGNTVYVLDGTTKYEASGKAGIIIKSECGGAEICGSCVVNVLKGEYEQSGSEKFSQRRRDRAGKGACMQNQGHW
jgi:uncharacterized 2Fe-2S/4Fe-4S cluster protein (DUF4445 family)